MTRDASDVTIESRALTLVWKPRYALVVAFTALFALLWQPALAQSPTYDYYIGPSGSDSNPGTLSQPWAITALNTKQAVYAGRSVGLVDGTYQVGGLASSIPHDGYTAILRVRGGSQSSPTIIAAVNGRKAIIDARNGSTYPPNNPVIGNYGVSANSYTTIDGVVLRGSSSKGMYWGDYGAANSSSSNRYPGIVIKNCEFTGADGRALAYGNNLSLIELAGTSNAQITNNYFHDNIGYAVGSDDHFSATLQWYGEESVYEYNSVVDSGGFYGKENGNFGTVIRYNFVDTTGWSASAIQDFSSSESGAHGVPTVIHHNVLIAAKGADMRPTLGAGYLPDPLQFYSNTIVVLTSGQSAGLLVRVASGKASVYNNVIYSQASGDQALMALNVDADGIVDYNFYYDTANSYVWNVFSSLLSIVRQGAGGFSSWKATMGGGVDQHSSSGVNPGFAATGSAAIYYNLSAGSPAKAAGSSNGTPGGASTDVGAWGNGTPLHIGVDFSSVKPNAPNLSIN